MRDLNTQRTESPVPLAGVFAVVGCDGTGKSTLTHDLRDTLRSKGPAERLYLGLVSGDREIETLLRIGNQLSGVELQGRSLCHVACMGALDPLLK